MTISFRDWTPEMVAAHNAKVATCRGLKQSDVSFPLRPSPSLVPIESNFTVPGLPVSKPRQTRRDQWQQRPCVMRYREYADRIRAAAGKILENPGEIQAKFYLPMPRSWGKRKCQELDGKPHRQKPDLDNLLKALMDALFEQDCGIWAGSESKVWCRQGQERTEVTIKPFIA